MQHTHTQRRFLVRMERARTGSWCWQWFNLPLPIQDSPGYDETLVRTMNDFQLAFFGKEWEIVTYLPEEQVEIEELERFLSN